jgi:hypothetical protein
MIVGGCIPRAVTNNQVSIYILQRSARQLAEPGPMPSLDAAARVPE